MSGATTLLATRQPSFAARVRELVSSIRSVELHVVADIEQLREHLSQEHLALVILHVENEQDHDAVPEILQLVTALRKPIATLAVSQIWRPEHALRMMRLGLTDYLNAQTELGRLALMIDLSTARARLTRSRSSGAEVQLESLGVEQPFLFGWGRMGDLVDQLRKVAALDTTILFTGETGTGKTRLARAVHELSSRRARPFFVVNCGALSPNLTESELFGHRKGAFTGAEENRDGKFRAASDGTLLLDDVESLSARSQAKILRAVDERIFEPVGSDKSEPVRARLIAATNQSLEQSVAEGKFRADLYYRLNVVEFRLPPLRERADEIPPLVMRFVADAAKHFKRRTPTFSATCMAAMQEYPWKGNVRELKNVIERCVTLVDGDEIEIDDLPERVRNTIGLQNTAGTPAVTRHQEGHCGDLSAGAAMRQASTTEQGAAAIGSRVSQLSALARARMQAEIERIVEALDKHENNRSRAARELGISRVALYKKLHKFGLIES